MTFPDIVSVVCTSPSEGFWFRCHSQGLSYGPSVITDPACMYRICIDTEQKQPLAITVCLFKRLDLPTERTALITLGLLANDAIRPRCISFGGGVIPGRLCSCNKKSHSQRI